MSIVISDADLQKISLEYVQYPDLLANAIASKAATQLSVDDALAVDASNKNFTDFYRSLADLYSQEFNYLGEDAKTGLPDEPSLISGAKRVVKYYPVLPPDTWVNLPPKIQLENNGNPTLPYSGINEPELITEVTDSIDRIKNGIVGGVTDAVETDYTGGTILRVDDVTVFAPNDFIVVENGPDGLFAVIDSIVQDTLPDTSGDLNITVFVFEGVNLPIGTTVTTTVNGFNNDQREESAVLTPFEAGILSGFKSSVDIAVQNLENFYNDDYLPLLTSNDDLKNKTLNENSIVDIGVIKTAIDTWQAAPSTNPTGTGTESRFGDIEFSSLESALATRVTEVADRITEIITILGSASQDSQGVFSGTGVYFDFVDWENKRINTATGSLAKYFNILLALDVQQQVIDNLNSNHAEQDIYFRIEPLSLDATGSETILVGDTTGFEVADNVKVIAEGQIVVTASVLGKTATVLELDVIISSSYSLAALARVVKQK